MKIQQHKKNVLLFLNSWEWHENSTKQNNFLLFVIFPLQQWLNERNTILRYT